MFKKILVPLADRSLVSAGRGTYAYLKDESGNPFRIESGGVLVAGWDYVSGQPRLISVDESGQLNIEANVSVTTNVSGQTVNADVSGQTIRVDVVSGGGVVVKAPTIVRVPFASVSGQNPLFVTDASGGVALASGDCQSVTLRMLPDAAYSGHFVYLGSNTSGAMPYSGYGFALGAGDGITLPIDNFNRLRAVSTLSGARVSYIGVQGFGS